LIEEDFYLGRPDKLMFLMKEFRAHLSPSLIKHMSNPLLVAKLDVKVNIFIILNNVGSLKVRFPKNKIERCG
jgi:hypothetical protein